MGRILSHIVTGVKYAIVGFIAGIVSALLLVPLMFLFSGAQGLLAFLTSPPDTAALVLPLLLGIGILAVNLWVTGVIASKLWGWR